MYLIKHFSPLPLPPKKRSCFLQYNSLFISKFNSVCSTGSPSNPHNPWQKRYVCNLKFTDERITSKVGKDDRFYQSKMSIVPVPEYVTCTRTPEGRRRRGHCTTKIYFTAILPSESKNALGRRKGKLKNMKITSVETIQYPDGR